MFPAGLSLAPSSFHQTCFNLTRHRIAGFSPCGGGGCITAARVRPGKDCARACPTSLCRISAIKYFGDSASKRWASVHVPFPGQSSPLPHLLKRLGRL
jgi:hypothetical protein